jgi:hypothetical protein
MAESGGVAQTDERRGRQTDAIILDAEGFSQEGQEIRRAFLFLLNS